MKLISSFFSSSSSSSSTSANSSKKKRSSKDRSMSRSDTPSFGSSTSSGGSDSFSKSTVRTPRTVIIGRNASGLDAEYWSSSPKAAAALPSSYRAPAAKAADATVAVSPAVSELFGVFDRDGDGKITKEELELVLRRLGRSDPPSEEEVEMMMAEVDRDGDGCISLEEFGVLGPALAPGPEWGTAPGGGGLGEEELKDAFAIFDADGDGKISAEELQGVFLTLGDDACTLDDCRRMIGGVDSSGDGFVCFNDFARMMDGQRY